MAALLCARGPPPAVVDVLVLDLHAAGEIFAHVDSLEYVGPYVAGVSLGSAVIMRLTSVPPADHTVHTAQYTARPVGPGVSGLSAGNERRCFDASTATTATPAAPDMGVTTAKATTNTASVVGAAEPSPDSTIDVLLPPGSLYILTFVRAPELARGVVCAVFVTFGPKNCICAHILKLKVQDPSLLHTSLIDVGVSKLSFTEKNLLALNRMIKTINSNDNCSILKIITHICCH